MLGATYVLRRVQLDMKIHAQGTCDFLAAIRAYEGDYELKFDGCRAIGFKIHNRVHLVSRNGKDFSHRFPALVLGARTAR